MAKVFISYSTKSPYSVSLSGILHKALEDKGHKPFLDRKDIKTGKKWRSEINHWLISCKAVVFLYSREAIDESVWVPFETSIIALRKALNPNLKVIHILLEEVKVAELSETFFEPTEFDQLQCIPWTGKNEQDLACEIIGMFSEEIQCSDPDADAWVGTVADLLGAAGPTALKLCAEALEFDIDSLALEGDGNRFFASQFLAAFADNEKVVLALRKLRRGMSGEKFNQLKKEVIPHWVNAKAAGQLAKITQRPERSRVVAINGSNPIFAEHYAMKSFWGNQEVLFCPTTCAAGHDREELLLEIEQAILNRLSCKKSDLKNNRSLKNCKLIVPVHDKAANDPMLLEDLKDLVPQATIVILPGLDIDSWRKHGFEDITCIAPLLNDELETLANNFIDDVNSIK